MKRLLTGFLAGAIGLASLATAQQSSASDAVRKGLPAIAGVRAAENETLEIEKKDIDFIVEANILPALYLRSNMLSETVATVLYPNHSYLLRLNDSSGVHELAVGYDGFDKRKYDTERIIQYTPFKVQLPNFNASVSYQYNEQIKSEDGVLRVTGTVNNEPLNLTFVYKKGALIESTGTLGSAALKLSYTPRTEGGLENLVKSATLTITDAKGKSDYKLEFGIEQTDVASYTNVVTKKTN